MDDLPIVHLCKNLFLEGEPVKKSTIIKKKKEEKEKRESANHLLDKPIIMQLNLYHSC